MQTGFIGATASSSAQLGMRRSASVFGPSKKNGGSPTGMVTIQSPANN